MRRFLLSKRPVLYVMLVVVLSVCQSQFSFAQQLLTFNGKIKNGPKDALQQAIKLKLNRAELQKLFAAKSPYAEITMSLENRNVVMELKKAQLFAGNFSAILASSLENFDYKQGYYLQGKIKGEENSLVAISIFDTYAGGVIAFGGNNYNLCIANDFTDFNTDDYLLYADKDLNIPMPVCSTMDDGGASLNANDIRVNRGTTTIGCPVDIYFEAANRMYTAQGSNPVNVMNYVTTMFNAVQLLYNVENILVQIREVKIWNIPDPEDGLTTTANALASFKARMASGFNGDLAHYITYKNLGGGIAYRDILCVSDVSFRTAVSGNMVANYVPLPNYSFTINVVTHETGHNLGSPHTHSCTWPGGAIDDCYTTEGGCPPGPPPVNGGTIMSYCHLTANGINLSNGFGPLPGNKIRTSVADASTFNCICNCANIALDITKTDVGCGNPTGSATAVVTGGTAPYTYLWSNGDVNATATGLAPGTYYVKVTGSTPNCTVIKGVKINASGGSTIPVTINPAATNVVKCTGETHTITASTTSPGTINYEWFKNGISIPGAINPAYAVTADGAYYVQLSNGTCLGQSQTVNVSFQNIATPTITLSGTLPVCDNESVTLSIPATSFAIEWRLNGTPIPGAVTTNYSASAAGDYTVRLYSATAAGCNAISAPVTVTTKPAPSAAVSPTGNAGLCEGEKITLTHTAIAGENYDWYNNGTLINGQNNAFLSVNTSGTYTLKVTATNGCKATSSPVTVIVNPKPSATLTPTGEVKLCIGGTITLTTPLNAGMNYTWQNNGITIAGAGGNTFGATASGLYSVVVQNTATGCKNSSAATKISMIPPPTIFAGNDTIVATQQPVLLHAYETSNYGVNHYEWTPATGLNDAFSQTPIATLNADQRYIVKGTNAIGCSGTATVLVKVYKGPALYVPLAFSPNKDGRNDILKCFSVGISKFKSFTIFNRYGQTVFITSDPLKGWDGLWKGNPASPGTYIWIAEALDYKFNPMSARGSFVLIR